MLILLFYESVNFGLSFTKSVSQQIAVIGYMAIVANVYATSGDPDKA